MLFSGKMPFFEEKSSLYRENDPFSGKMPSLGDFPCPNLLFPSLTKHHLDVSILLSPLSR